MLAKFPLCEVCLFQLLYHLHTAAVYFFCMLNLKLQLPGCCNFEIQHKNTVGSTTRQLCVKYRVEGDTKELCQLCPFVVDSTMADLCSYLTGYKEYFTDKDTQPSCWIASLKLQSQTMLNMCCRQVL